MATTYLYRDYLAAQTDGSLATISVWVKRSGLGSRNKIIGAYDGGAAGAYLEFFGDDTLRYHSGTGLNTTNAVFRDTSGWYHILVQHDSGGAGASDQVKIYVNGVLQSLSTNSGTTVDSQIGKNGVKTVIGVEESAYSSSFFDGSMSFVYYIDGTAYAPTVFGSTDADTGEWTINTGPAVTMGNNGFLIMKNGNTITDQSTNSNDFTLGAGTLTNTEDCPDDVFCTLNPLIPTADLTFSAGNTKMVSGTSGVTGGGIGTIGVNKGKFYWEIKMASLLGNNTNGVISELTTEINDNVSGLQNDTGVTQFRNDDGGEMVKDGTETTADYGLFTAGQIMGIALNADDYEISIYRNGSAIVTDYALSTTRGNVFPYFGSGISTTWEVNFGNGYFGTTAISTAGTNASNIGIFEHDVPTGYTALSTKGLQE